MSASPWSGYTNATFPTARSEGSDYVGATCVGQFCKSYVGVIVLIVLIAMASPASLGVQEGR
eukprot:778215-Prorocentrum_lima.AAC.1